jgi:protein-S-isoprenylcysteine O-methyltransferase Ste14
MFSARLGFLLFGAAYRAYCARTWRLVPFVY